MPEPKLSIVVATYRMQREAPRTIASLLPPLQRGVDDLDYEIIVVDNGSPEPLDIGDAVAAAARPVRLVRIAPEDASASPASCINQAVREHATGDWLMVCIDGARLASSHLVRRTADVLTRHPDAFTFVGSRHLGPKRQMQSVKEGYDQAAEDRLLDTVPWAADLDHLYSISVWAGAHDRKNPLLQNESNAFAMARATWDALGGYDEGFSRPGGGLCNLELFSRCVNRGRGLNVLLYGESTFHQVHGGAATSHDGYFGASLPEFTDVTGEEYHRPSFPFLADLGERYGRIQAVGRFLGAETERTAGAPSAPPPCVIVLGMHRSGTSLLTGSLEVAGLHLGDVNHAATFNRKGNKENESIRSFHNELLVKNGASWDRPPKGQVRWDRSDEERARSLVEPHVRAALPWGFKDPRTLWMVEGWLRLLPSARIIGVFRHPSLVVRSLAARTGDLTIGTREALDLWCAYNAELLRLHRKYQFPLVHFSSEGAFQEDFIAPLTSFARSMGLSGSLDRFFDHALVHQTERGPAGSLRARFLFRRLVSRSRQTAGSGAPLAPPASSQPSA